MGPVARLLAMDRTTLTSALRPLEPAGLVRLAVPIHRTGAVASAAACGPLGAALSGGGEVEELPPDAMEAQAGDRRPRRGAPAGQDR